MPELPEVETVVRGLREHVVGHTIVTVRVLWPKTIETPSVEEFMAVLAGRQVISAFRRGKYALIGLDDGSYLSIHLRMTGRLFILPVGSEPSKHTRIVWTLDNRRELHFVDPRKFGRIALLSADSLASLDARLGPEPLDTLSPQSFADRLRRRSAAIKPVLLDQTLIAGLGNIYADEALFQAGIHPQRPANSLSEAEITRLYESIRQVLALAVERHGTTLRDEQFKGLEGRMGSNQGFLAVFRRTGEPCPRCGSPVNRIRLGGRGTHFCPQCQK